MREPKAAVLLSFRRNPFFTSSSSCLSWRLGGVGRKRTQCNDSIHFSLLSAILLDGLVPPYSFTFLFRQTQRVAISSEEWHGKQVDKVGTQVASNPDCVLDSSLYFRESSVSHRVTNVHFIMLHILRRTKLLRSTHSLSLSLSIYLSFSLSLSLAICRSSIHVKQTLEIIFVERKHQDEDTKDASRAELLGQLHLLPLLSPMYDYSTEHCLSQRCLCANKIFRIYCKQSTKFNTQIPKNYVNKILKIIFKKLSVINYLHLSKTFI